MADFHDRLRAVQAEVWDAGPDASPELETMMTALTEASLPSGIVRLSTSRMCGGRHLAPQAEIEVPRRGVLRLEAVARARKTARDRLRGLG